MFAVLTNAASISELLRENAHDENGWKEDEECERNTHHTPRPA
jgi:hypothetical protein